MKPVPWFWIVRVILSTGAVVAWGYANPHTSLLELFVIAVVAIIAIEGLRIGYEQEQARIIRKRSNRES